MEYPYGQPLAWRRPPPFLWRDSIHREMVTRRQKLCATVSEKDYYEENARCILTVWGQQDTQLNDYANRGWGGLTRSFYRERWKRFTDGVIAAVSEDKPFDEDKFHQDITQFEYNWTLQKDSFPIVSEEDPIQIADSLILKYDTYFTKAQ